MFNWLKRLATRAGPSPTVVIDVETTGFGKAHRVVTLAAVRVEGYAPTGEWLYLVFNPERSCQREATAVHGWTRAVLKHQPIFAEHAEEVLTFLGRRPMVGGHNVGFDVDFLAREFERLGVTWQPAGTVCSMERYKAAHPDRRAKLSHCLAHAGLAEQGDVHDALRDAWLSAALLAWLAGKPVPPMPDMPGAPANFRPVP